MDRWQKSKRAVCLKGKRQMDVHVKAEKKQNRAILIKIRPPPWRLSHSAALEATEVEAVKGELARASCTSFLCPSLLSSFSGLERRGQGETETAKPDWKQRPECFYFWCRSRSGGKERRESAACCSRCLVPVCT